MNDLAIISDIHGNLPALEAVLADIKSRGIKNIICLGDLAGYYCGFNEVIDILRLNNIPTVMGNHDYALSFNFGVIERSKTCTHILKWQLNRCTPENFEYLRGLPLSIDHVFGNRQVKIVHGGLKDNLDEYLFDVDDEYFRSCNFNQDILITGHTHLLSYKSFYSGKIWLNPGSVGQPRDFNNSAAYLIIGEDFLPSFVRVPYDFYKVIHSMQENGFAPYISEGLRTGKKIS